MPGNLFHNYQLVMISLSGIVTSTPSEAQHRGYANVYFVETAPLAMWLQLGYESYPGASSELVPEAQLTTIVYAPGALGSKPSTRRLRSSATTFPFS